MFGSDADEIGLLALTGGRAESLVDSTLEIRRELRRKPHDHGNDISFRIACSLAYLEHAELQDPRLNAMKALLDMQGLIQARQSAAAGGAAAAT